MRTRRTVGALCALFIVALAASGSGTRISNRGARTSFWFWDFDSSSYLDSSASRMIVAYPSYLAGNDTTGNGTALTWMDDGSDAWYLDVAKDEIWRVWKYDTLSDALLIDSVYTPGGQVGDSAIASVAAFMPGVIPPWALAADSAFALDSVRVEALGAGWLFADSAVVGYMEHTPRSNKAYIDSLLPNDSTSVYVSITSASILNGAIINEDVNASAAIALSKLATTGTLQADVLEVDTLKVEDDGYIYKTAPFMADSCLCVYDTLLISTVTAEAHTVPMSCAKVGDLFYTAWIDSDADGAILPPYDDVAVGAAIAYVNWAFYAHCATNGIVSMTPASHTDGYGAVEIQDSVLVICDMMHVGKR